MDKNSAFSPALIRRLPAYFRTLIRFYGTGKSRVSSEELAHEIRLTPSQVRADLKVLGCQGQRSYGYGIPSLYKRIADILQLSDKFSAVIVGSTPLSYSIADTPIFSKRGIKLTAHFDDDGVVSVDKEDVLPFAELEGFLQSDGADILITAGSEESAKAALSYAEGAEKDIEVWNFTDLELFSESITVKNVHLSDYLMMLCLMAHRDGEYKN